MNSKELIKKLEDAGFTFSRSCGTSHRVYKKEGFPIISVPFHGTKDIAIGTAKD
ncbi:MAG: type II toxin-antitoxin system HicA family toxin [Fibrobacteraceae bacterium]|nr:type II toxin-antitoxin system HicA family toxin [Fibrobacteraceae bacterium]